MRGYLGFLSGGFFVYYSVFSKRNIANLLQSGGIFPIIRRTWMENAGPKINHRGSNFWALRGKMRDFGFTNCYIGRRRGNRGQGEEVLSRVFETGEISQRRDPALGIGVEQARRNWGGATLYEF